MGIYAFCRTYKNIEQRLRELGSVSSAEEHLLVRWALTGFSSNCYVA